MLRQVFILLKDNIIYQWLFGNALSATDIENLHFRMKQDAMKKTERPIGYFDHYMDVETVKEVHAYYLKIMNKISK